MKATLLKQAKAISGGGISVIPVLALVEWINVTFSLGMNAGAMTALAGLFILLVYGVIYFVPNIDPSIVKVDDIDISSALMEATKGYNISPDIVEGMADIVYKTIKETSTSKG